MVVQALNKRMYLKAHAQTPTSDNPPPVPFRTLTLGLQPPLLDDPDTPIFAFLDCA